MIDKKAKAVREP